MSSFPAHSDYARRGSRETIRSLDSPTSYAMTTTQPPPPSSRPGPRKKRVREAPMTFSLSPDYFPEEPDLDQSPTDTMAPQPPFTPRPASTASRSPQIRRERHSMPYLPSGSLEAAFPGSLASVGPFSTRSEIVTSRSPSTETVKGPTSNHDPPSPLTGFPPWSSGSDGGCEARGWRDTDHEDQQATRHRHDSVGRIPLILFGAKGRWVLSAVIHAVVLAIQFTAALAVLSALVWIAFWKKNETDVEFWEWLWKYAEPSLVGVILLCSITLLAHEAKILSSVILLYLQSAILVLSTAASIAMWVRCFGESNRAIKGVLMGCNVLMWGLALFGFVRAVVIWKVEVKEEDDMRREYERFRETRSVSYGTFVPWGESPHGHEIMPR